MILSILALALFLFILEPWVTYFLDVKSLRRFPNATYCSGVSNLAFMLQRWRGYPSKQIHAAHETHSILRIGPNTVSFSSPSAIRAIYGHSTPCVKGGSYEHNVTEHSGLIDVIDKKRHAFKRRILSNAFATRNLEQWEFKVSDKVGRLLRQFDRIANDAASESGHISAVDIRRWFNLFTVEAIVDIALSQKLGFLERGDSLVPVNTSKGTEKHVDFIESLHSSRRATASIVFSDWFRPLRAVLKTVPGWFRNQWLVGEEFNTIVEHLTRQRLEMHQAGHYLDDLTSCLLRDKSGQDRNPTTPDVEGDVAAFLDAGSDTTAIALTNLFYFLLTAPDVLSRLRQEVDANAAFDDNGVAQYSSLKHLPYLRACIDESLRLRPPVSTGLHRLTPPEGQEIDGHWIPGKTIVVVPIYTAHRNPKFFPDPEKYLPERWLGEGMRVAQSTFIPFSEGSRGCIGRNITYIEQTVLLATLVHRYDLRLLDANWQLRHEEAFLVWPGSLPLSIRRREVDSGP
ncbi:hypothetical protein BHE90_017050 [Fusarium euwallaceae]|uniref:Cytochrome P450 monooxygenase n=1 Tax=Fusarium euwallaceae TaxID=1147111 RepID=A0A430KYN2_9HYPO|nr:hypothetical protein BHE90_017050 [Fusarium euwallaceae]